MTKIPDFKNKKIYEESITHRSFLNETQENISSNERLEFLGDSILSFLVSDHIFSKFPDFDEGKLTNLRSLIVNTKSLAESARELKLGDKLKLSKGEEESGGRNNQGLLADAFEALIGGLFLDQGIDTTRKFITDTLLHKADHFIKNNMLKDPKSLLQEFVQAKKYSPLIYSVVSEEGPPHSKTFTVEATIGDRVIGVGRGKSKQEAEEKAAKEALAKIKK